MSDKIPMSEILAPAGDAACAKAAIRAGADAVYLGYSSFSARASAENFGRDSLEEIVGAAHFSGVKVYVAMNTLIKDAELPDFLRALEEVWETGVDAIILQDVFLGGYIHSLRPDIRLHLSTQAGICNASGAEYAKEQGFSRVILARETPLAEIGRISPLIETEAFVQGALCTCFSGQCYFSSFAGGNSGNRGRCKQPCRKKYSFDRPGFEKFAYALSPADLSVGKSLFRLKEAGVSSFKIEGRMRRPEYVASAVRYYRGILDDADERELSIRLSDLKRAYNRGDYTKGLAFGQDASFLSRSVQGHIGEKVGVVSGGAVRGNRNERSDRGGEYPVKSDFAPRQGDAFKVLRDGAEAGGARFSRAIKGGFTVFSAAKLLPGDEVFVTTDAAASERALSGGKNLPVRLSLRFLEGEPAEAKIRAEGAERVWRSEEILPPAKDMPLTEADLKSCFLKTDGVPMDVRFEEIRLGKVFLPKSRLNAFRRLVYREFYDARARSVRLPKPPVPPLSMPEGYAGKNEKTAAIVTPSELGKIHADVVVFKPDDYAALLPDAFAEGHFEKYLYLPVRATKEDLEQIGQTVRKYSLDGIYAENFDGIILARRTGCRLFAGTGFNLTNAADVARLIKEPSLSCFALSKELSETEQAALSGANAFVLAGGGIKLMDLCYCPFGRSCAECDKKGTYRLTDEEGRTFFARRFRDARGECRFEIYNCADLSGFLPTAAGTLTDRTLPPLKDKTAGHRRKSVL